MKDITKTQRASVAIATKGSKDGSKKVLLALRESTASDAETVADAGAQVTRSRAVGQLMETL